MQNTILRVDKISKKYNENNKLLEDISFSISRGEKIGLIGNNGSGKTTLLKIISGLEKNYNGSVKTGKDIGISYMKQKIDSEESIFKFLDFNSNLAEILNLFKKLNLNFENLYQKINDLSGGEKTKVYLIKIILENKEIVLLDEPTNSLDEESILFLEDYILNSKQTFLIASHNRSFLDNVVEKIFFQDIFREEFKIYSGNYSSFVKIFESQKERQKTLYFQNQKKKKSIVKEIERATEKTRFNKNKDYSKDNDKYINYSKTQSAQKKASNNLKAKKTKLNNFEEINNFKKERFFDFNFKTSINSSSILETKEVVRKFGNKKIGPVSFFVQKNDRIFLKGKNGSGKTTILKMILNKIEKSSGEVKVFEKTKIAYLSQALNENKNEIVFDFLEKENYKSKTEIIAVLEKIGINFKIIKNKIKDLSEGQKIKVFIATVILGDFNLLILDEPTNNIDLEILEKFESALCKYNGAIIFTSHDRYFVEKIKPNKIIEIL